ncbi:undecaprenyl-diphosphate phosphatase [Thermaerobacter sp. PB12/4term]|uniref:undecaprenyl-diphosphate phosphatase n=1 Tax=Thermaerobacter sp. PB12/4term TaxID=2293838 RepID=UPI000E32B92D|nr:undecaprenyl-diphosphate phosphatase [Thermaerobacter sp. PB12/4term]QIA26990.1 undecaprenyl-diphosphate phosphatase [Thermaerobacter sp. PB12/4term]
MELSLWNAVLLGVVQGLTEFLPVSSSGHLAVAEDLLGLQLPGLAFEVVVHLGTLAAVLVVYGADLWAALAGFLRTGGGLAGGRRPGSAQWWQGLDPGTRLGWLVIAGTIPAAVAGLAFEGLIEAAFESPVVVAAFWIFTGALLWWAGRRPPGGRPLARATLADAVVVGLFQALALFPGVSRSGSTLVGGLVRGLEREEAARLSFLLSVPAILGAAILQLPDLVATGGGAGWAPLLAGAVAAGVTGYMAIRWLLRWLIAGRLPWFAYYLWAVAILLLFYSGWRG